LLLAGGAGAYVGYAPRVLLFGFACGSSSGVGENRASFVFVLVVVSVSAGAASSVFAGAACSVSAGAFAGTACFAFDREPASFTLDDLACCFIADAASCAFVLGPGFRDLKQFRRSASCGMARQCATSSIVAAAPLVVLATASMHPATKASAVVLKDRLQAKVKSPNCSLPPLPEMMSFE
jgi:hypothetical protein